MITVCPVLVHFIIHMHSLSLSVSFFFYQLSIYHRIFIFFFFVFAIFALCYRKENSKVNIISNECVFSSYLFCFIYLSCYFVFIHKKKMLFSCSPVFPRIHILTVNFILIYALKLKLHDIHLKVVKKIRAARIVDLKKIEENENKL